MMRGVQGALLTLSVAVTALSSDDMSDVTFGENPYYYENWCNHAAGALTYLVIHVAVLLLDQFKRKYCKIVIMTLLIVG